VKYWESHDLLPALSTSSLPLRRQEIGEILVGYWWVVVKLQASGVQERQCKGSRRSPEDRPGIYGGIIPLTSQVPI